MARRLQRENAKRASRPNPREDRNRPHDERKDRNRSYDRNTSHAPREDTNNRPKKKVELLPRNIAQEHYLDLLEDLDNDVVIATGPAGTGKTMLCTLYALRELQAGNIEKIIIVRPTVAVGTDALGFLPGDLTSKLAPWAVPVTDLIKQYYSVQMVEKMIANEVIEFGALGMMRGRTLPENSILILDEAQNATVDQCLMMLTRIGHNARIFMTGDVRQADRAFARVNALNDLIYRLKASPKPHISLAEFEAKDVERHHVVQHILDLYDRDGLE